MWEICIKYVPMLGLAIMLNTFLGMYNNIFNKNLPFKKKFLFQGLIKAMLFVVCIFGLAYIADNTDIINPSFSPEIILQTGVVYYAGKVALSLKDMLFPAEKGKSLTQIKEGIDTALVGDPSLDTSSEVVTISSEETASVSEDTSHVTPIDTGGES